MTTTIANALMPQATGGGFDLQAAFRADPARFAHFHAEALGMTLDFSRCWLDAPSWAQLLALAEQCGLREAIHDLLCGAMVNGSEQQAATHTASRASEDAGLQQMLRAVAAWRADPEITDLIHVGVGGSDLGPRVVVQALQEPAKQQPLRVHFLTNYDDPLPPLEARRCRIVLTSKSFSTDETMLLAAQLRQWLTAAGGDVTRQFFAVTAKPEVAQNWGIAPDQIFTFAPTIGGRYSLWSAAGVAIAAALGPEVFRELRRGAAALDAHFASAPFGQNLPVIMGLLTCWHAVRWQLNAEAYVPYCQNLQQLPAYLQQLMMESNGKQVSQAGQPLAYPTGPLVFGGPGSTVQHSFFQWLHQGTDIVPVHFVGVRTLAASPLATERLLGYMLAQAEALVWGRGAAELANEPPARLPHRLMPGNRPSTILLLPRLDAYQLGALLALYEHQTFVAAQAFGINPFDQWGVELGKQLLPPMLQLLQQQPATLPNAAGVAALLASSSKNR